jgi:hypothetical protein
VDDDHFMKHYNHVHADLTLASKGFGVYKIQRYVQASFTPIPFQYRYFELEETDSCE